MAACCSSVLNLLFIQIQEYLKTKIQQEKEYEKQHKTKNQRQQRELARLWKLQKASQSLAQTKNEIITERIQEEVKYFCFFIINNIRVNRNKIKTPTGAI